MSIPANDAFTLNSHSYSIGRLHSSSMSTRRSLTRSPSPKIIFPSSLQSTDSSKVARRRPPQRLSSNGSIGFVSDSGILEDVHEDKVRETPPKRKSRSPEQKKVGKEPIDWEVPRKMLHSSIGFIVLPLYISHSSVHSVIFYLSVATAVIFSADLLRFRSPSFAKMYESVLGFLMRESEKRKTNGVIWYLLGAIFVLSMYPLDIAIVSILILSWCDTAASTFGRLYGRQTRPLPQSIPIPFSDVRIPLLFARRKSLAGFIAASVMGSLVAIGFWGWLAPLGESLPSWSWSARGVGWLGTSIGLSAVGVVTGLVAGVAEALDVGSLDDNLTLPIISGGVLWGLFKVIDWMS